MRASHGIQKYKEASGSKKKASEKSPERASKKEAKVDTKAVAREREEEKKRKAAASAKAATAAAKAPAPQKPRAEKPAPVAASAPTVSAKPVVEEAIDEKIEATAAVQEEQILQAEIAKEIEEEAAQTSQLVKADFSPVNTTRERLIIEYAPLIKYIAQKIAARLPANIELDDLISSGVIGLMDAIDKYDSSRDNKFKTYAEFRIRGAILDELRAQDWVPRSVREKAKALERCYQRIEQEKGRQATDEEVCANLGINQQEFNDLLTQVRGVSLLSVDDIANLSKADKRSIHGIGDNDSRQPTPFNEVSLAHLKRMIADAIRDLPEKQRLVLSLYYYEDLNLKEIGRVLDVTESRVSQLHTQAVLKLKARLRNNWDEFVSLMA